MKLISIMNDNVNVNDNLYKGNSSAEEYNKDPDGDLMPFYEETTVMKTEVKEEIYDFEMSVDEIESTNERTFSPEIIFKEEDLELTTNEGSTFSPPIIFEQDNIGLVKNTEQSLNENLDVGNCQTNGVDLQNNKYRCPLCHSEFGEEVYLRSHYEQCFVPAKKKLFECKDPGEKVSLKQHVLTKQSTESNKYKCSNCNYATHTKSLLLVHSRNHSGKKSFKCTYKNCKCSPTQKGFCECNTCECAYVSKSGLQHHILIKHSTRPKKYKCSNCKYATHRKAHLVIHNGIHNNEKLFKCTYRNCRCTPGQQKFCECNVCKYAYATSNALKQHMLRKHSTEPKKYKCSHCKFATHFKSSLTKHEGNHSGEKTFKCIYKNCKWNRTRFL